MSMSGTSMGKDDSKIVTKEVTKSKEHMGWKVYVSGEKFPKKPVDYYTGMTEEQAVKKALNIEAGGKS